MVGQLAISKLIGFSLVIWKTIDAECNFIGNITFSTSEHNIIKALKTIKTKEKYLATKEDNLRYWVTQVSKPYVTEVISSDPKENALIFRGSQKKDKISTKKNVPSP